MHDEYSVPAEPGYLSFHRFRCGFCGEPFDKEPAFVNHVQGHHRTRKRVKTTDALPKAKVEPIQRHPEAYSAGDVVDDGKRKKHLSDSLLSAKFTPVQGNIFSRIRVKTDNVSFGSGCKTSLKTEFSSVNKVILLEPENESYEGSIKEEFLPKEAGAISCSSQAEEGPVSGTVPKSPRVRKSLYEKMEEASVSKRKIFKLTPSSIAFLHSDLFDSHRKSLRYALCKKESPSATGSLPGPSQGEEVLNCAECHFRATSSDALLSHMTALHSSSIAQLQKKLSNFHDCQEVDCHFRAQTKEALAVHVRVLHSGEPSDPPPSNRFHDCTKCCFRAKDQASLVAHGRVLHGDTPDTASLSESSQTMYNCQYCSFNAIDENTLEDHIMSEHLASLEPCLPSHPAPLEPGLPTKPPYRDDAKLYCCGICDSYYSYTHQAIVRHIQAGCNSEFYKCPDCDYSAVKSTHLTRHLQKVHPELL